MVLTSPSAETIQRVIKPMRRVNLTAGIGFWSPHSANTQITTHKAQDTREVDCFWVFNSVVRNIVRCYLKVLLSDFHFVWRLQPPHYLSAILPHRFLGWHSFLQNFPPHRSTSGCTRATGTFYSMILCSPGIPGGLVSIPRTPVGFVSSIGSVDKISSIPYKMLPLRD